MFIMKSKQLSINNWNDSILGLSSRPSQNLKKLTQAGIETIEQLVWIFPLRSEAIPPLQSFKQVEIGQLFFGHGKILNSKLYPAFGRRGKKSVQLFNAVLTVQDQLSDSVIDIKFFNLYPNYRKKIQELKTFYFLGKPSESKGKIIFSNPQVDEVMSFEQDASIQDYPTVAGVPGKEIKKFISKIPSFLWEQELSLLPSHLCENLNLISLNKALKAIHVDQVSSKDSAHFIDRIKYEEFLTNHLKVQARKNANKHLRAFKISSQIKDEEKLFALFPYELTIDQKNVLKQIILDLKSGRPMMRLIQGDVGSGKTTVAIIASLLMIKEKKQVAFMCPTETLARQHFQTFQKILGQQISIELLVGSTTQKEKSIIYEKLESGKIELIIGTHSLIQDKVFFQDLGLTIIDEQHKFGVEQRLKLSKKGKNVHTLIMTATPIPRSLQLVQYGDLDISTIKTMPQGRKGIKTRIVQPTSYEKYLSFLKTRLSMGEQVYIVVPAIEESEHFDIENIESLSEFYQKYFNEFSISLLHGNLKPQEKTLRMQEFESGKSQLLISTSVIEVGINVPTATVMAIYNPERFGLSSLHQLRGRVGRGDKAGFCFLVSTKKLSAESLTRLQVIERSTDGFVISEADLKNRGQGDLFGSDQAGHRSPFKIAHIVEDLQLFQSVIKDYETLKTSQPEALNKILLKITEDHKITSTI